MQTTYPTMPGNTSRPANALEEHSPVEDLVEYLRDYAREKPEAAALWCLGVGFILGWKLKPW
jgi:hypothetical protein